MSLDDLAGMGGIGFVLIAVAVNGAYRHSGLPFPGSGGSLGAVTEAFAAARGGLKLPSVAAPAVWLCLTVFAAGLLSTLWRGGTGTGAWALVGFAGVLMQNATFMVVEALRFGLASAAGRGPDPVAGLWGLSNVLFGFNQAFLAIALLGFSAAGTDTGLFPGWQGGLGYASAALLFLAASASPFNADGGSRASLAGLIGWLGWAAWIIASSISLLRG